MRFTKNKVKNLYIGSDIKLSNAWNYQVFNQNTLIGEIIVSKLNIWILHKNEVYYIERDLPIKDLNKQVEYGTYTIKEYGSTGIMIKEMELNFMDAHYQFIRDTSEHPFHLLKKDSWGHFNFKLLGNEGNASYAFNIQQSVFDLILVQNPFISRVVNGEIMVNNLNNLEVLVGLMLVEKALFRYGQGSNNISSINS